MLWLILRWFRIANGCRSPLLHLLQSNTLRPCLALKCSAMSFMVANRFLHSRQRFLLKYLMRTRLSVFNGIGFGLLTFILKNVLPDGAGSAPLLVHSLRWCCIEGSLRYALLHTSQMNTFVWCSVRKCWAMMAVLGKSISQSTQCFWLEHFIKWSLSPRDAFREIVFLFFAFWPFSFSLSFRAKAIGAELLLRWWPLNGATGFSDGFAAPVVWMDSACHVERWSSNADFRWKYWWHSAHM